MGRDAERAGLIFYPPFFCLPISHRARNRHAHQPTTFLAKRLTSKPRNIDARNVVAHCRLSTISAVRCRGIPKSMTES